MKLLSILMKKFNTENVNVFDKIPASLIAFRHALQLGNISIGSDSSIQHQCIEQVSVSRCYSSSYFIDEMQLKVAFVALFLELRVCSSDVLLSFRTPPTVRTLF